MLHHNKKRQEEIRSEQDRKQEEATKVISLVQALRAKDNWASKVRDPEVRAKYRAEAIAQDVGEEIADKALSILETIAECPVPTMHRPASADSDVVLVVRVGGKDFPTSTGVLTADTDSMLHRQFSPPWVKPVDPTQALELHTATGSATVFEQVLAYLNAVKDGAACLLPNAENLSPEDFEGLLVDADFLGMPRLVTTVRICLFDFEARLIEAMKKWSSTVHTSKYQLRNLLSEKERLEKRLAALPGLIAEAEAKSKEVEEERLKHAWRRPLAPGDSIKLLKDASSTWQSATVVEDPEGGLKWVDSSPTPYARHPQVPQDLPAPTHYYHPSAEICSMAGGSRCDGLIPHTLSQSLTRGLDGLLHEKEMDLHPGSNCQVVDLIHPSLYPYIDKVTEVSDQAALEACASLDGETYCWLPAEFDVDSKGNVAISSYINNLSREQHPELYQDIAQTFAAMLPMFEEELDCPLREKRLQVVVKAAYYIIPPGESYEGSWHLEGMTHEHITAAGIFYLAVSDNIVNNKLEFREQMSSGGIQDYGDRAGEEMSLIEELGDVETIQDRCLVWKNDKQHKVGELGVLSAEQLRKSKRRRFGGAAATTATEERPLRCGIRKILCFFLVDPDVRIVSTAIVPPQQGVLPHKEALEHRQALMNKRKYHADVVTGEWEERVYSFCEH